MYSDWPKYALIILLFEFGIRKIWTSDTGGNDGDIKSTSPNSTYKTQTVQDKSTEELTESRTWGLPNNTTPFPGSWFNWTDVISDDFIMYEGRGNQTSLTELKEESADINSGCIANIKASTGNISSPQLTHTATAQCDWIITVPEQFKVRLKFLTFNLPPRTNERCLNGYVEIGGYDEDGSRAVHEGHFCGNMPPEDYISLDNRCWVYFFRGFPMIENGTSFFISFDTVQYNVQRSSSRIGLFALLIILAPIFCSVLTYCCLDCTLVVVPKNNKDLKLKDGEFETRKRVSMNYKKDGVYHGTIIRIHEDKQFLNRFATEACDKFLVGQTIKGLPEEIFSFEPEPLNMEGKRPRTITKKMQQSKSQSLAFEKLALKRKRKINDDDDDDDEDDHDEITEENNDKDDDDDDDDGDNNKRDVKDSKKKKRIKEKKSVNLKSIKQKSEKNAEIINSNQVLTELSYTPIKSQFVPSVPSNNISWNEEITAMEFEPSYSNLNAPVQTTEYQPSYVNLQNSSRPCYSQIKDYQQYNNTSTPSSTIGIAMEATKTAWNLDPCDVSYIPDVPTPPASVLDFFQLLLKPEVQEYLQGFCEYFGRTETSVQETIDTTDEEKNERIPSSLIKQNYLITGQAEDTFQRPEERSYQIQVVNEKDNCAEISGKKTPQMKLKQTHLRQSPRHQNQFSPRRSPRGKSELPTSQGSSLSVPFKKKLVLSPTKISTSESNQVRLIETSDICVDSDSLAKIVRKGKKEREPGYFVIRKIMPLVFSRMELATSRGQGLTGTKDGDLRPVLDKKTVQTVKDFTRGWCKLNQLHLPSEEDLNKGITEAVGYARKALKKDTKKGLAV